MHKNILITGVAGFIGSHLADRLLKAGCNVIGIDNFDPFYSRVIKENNIRECLRNPNFRLLELDIRDCDQLNKISEDVDLVIHLAAKAGVLPSIESPSEYISVNINGTFNILEFMRRRNVKKLVFASSSSIYGNNKQIPFTETDNVDHPISPYAFTKKSCELMNYNYHYLYKMDIVNLRFFTVYGPRQRPDLAIHKFVHMIDENKSVTMYGDGSTARDYTYVDDIVTGIEKAADYVSARENVYEIINIGNNRPVTLKELITKIYSLMNKEEKIQVLPAQKGDVDITYSNIDKAGKLLNYMPSTSIDDGLRKFVQWYKANRL